MTDHKGYWLRVHKIYGAVNGKTESRARVRSLMFNATGFKAYRSNRHISIKTVRKSMKAYKRRVNQLARNLKKQPGLARVDMRRLKSQVHAVLVEEESYVPYPDGDI